MILVAIPGALLVIVVLWDVFEAIVLPRRVTRRLRPARLFYRATWRVWVSLFGRVRRGDLRESALAFYGPLSLIMLLAAWAAVLVLAFAIVHWADGSALIVPNGKPRFRTDLYLSGTTFFTLGLGDVAPRTAFARLITVIEAGTGFGFLALVIGYLPVFYQSFSRREVNISLLDSRAGSPPTAGELLRRYASDGSGALTQLLVESERWSADLLESHLSYPVLAWFRSQHERQSWVAALAAILDASALLVVRGGDAEARAAGLTFAMARHAAVDLSQIFVAETHEIASDRLPAAEFDALRQITAENVHLSDADASGDALAALRATYEPFLCALADYLLMPLPPWVPAAGALSDWETSPTESAAIGVADPIDLRR